MNFFRQYIVPFLMLAMFILALLAVSSRAFLPSDMAAPAPVSSEEVGTIETQALAQLSQSATDLLVSQKFSVFFTRFPKMSIG